MVSLLKLGEISVDVEFKDIKNVHLSVYPPTGRVRIAAPSRMKLETVRVFAISKLAWIKQQQNKLRQQERETPREYLDRESHYLWGKRYLLKVVESDTPPCLELKHSRMLLRVRPGTNDEKKQAVMEEWYRTQLKNSVVPMLQKWETRIGVKVERVFVQRMKTKWGSCNERRCSIRLNTELAKKPEICLEYVVVHEVLHFLERHHNARFKSLMDHFMPQWRLHRDELNRSPLGHEDWSY